MRKLSMYAGLAIVAVGLTSVSAGSAFAMGCLNNNLPPMSLSHDDFVPNAGFGYNRDAYLKAQEQGNTCGTTKQSYSDHRNSLQTDPYQSQNTRDGQTRNN